MNFLEKNLEDIIYEADNNALNDRGLNIYGKKIRQTKIGNYGVSDLITYKRIKNQFGGLFLSIQLFELKKDAINMNTFNQACRYARGIQRFLTGKNIEFNIDVVLVGNQIDMSDSMCYLTNLIPCNSPEMPSDAISSIQFYTYKYDFDGITFKNRDGFVLTNEGFERTKKQFKNAFQSI